VIKIKRKFIILILMIMTIQHSAFTTEIGTIEEPPGNFMNENGEIVGLSVDFVKEIQRRIGDNTPIEIFPPARGIYNSLNKRNYLIFSLSRTEDRENKYHWISLVMRKPLVMFVKKGSGIKIDTLDDAREVESIGVLRSSCQHNFLLDNGFANVIAENDHKHNLIKLMAGRISILYHSVQGAAQLCSDLNIDFNELEPVLFLQISESSIAMSKDSDQSLVELWKNTAAEIKDDGTFELLAQKWLVYTEEYIGIDAEIRDGALNFWKE